MADFFQDSPNFINPLYATAEQRKQQNDYAAALMKRAGEGVTRPAGALGAMIDQLTSNIYRNASLQQEQAKYAQGLSDLSGQNEVTGGYAPALMAGGGFRADTSPPAGVGTGNPALAGSTPKAMDDAKVQAMYAQGLNADGTPSQNLSANPATPEPPVRVASLGPAGGASSPPGAPPPANLPMAGGAAAPNFNQRFAQAYPNSPGYSPMGQARIMMNDVIPPEARSVAAGIVTPKMGTDVFGKPTLESPIGGVRGLPAYGGATPGINRPITVGPEGMSTTYPSAAPGTPGGGGGIIPAPVLGSAMDAANRLRMNAAGSGAIADFKKSDLVAANDSPIIRGIAGTMLNDLTMSIAKGQPLPTGPTANWQNEIKRVVADLAPGAMRSQLESLASADSFDKLGHQLTSMLANSGRSDAQLFNNMQSVPGAHNSAEGAKALLQMVIQTANQREQLADFTVSARTPEEYRALKKQFYEQNPITNPITRQPIAQDLSGSSKTMAPTEGGGGPPAGTTQMHNGVLYRFKGGNPKSQSNWEPSG